MDDTDVEVTFLVKLRHRPLENGIKASLGFKASKGKIDSWAWFNVGSGRVTLLSETRSLKFLLDNRLRFLGLSQSVTLS